MRHVYLVTEGPHDVEVLGRLLKPGGFKRVQYVKDLEPFWERLVPKAFPHGGDLLRRVPVPVFFAAPGCSVAVHAADGISKLVSSLEVTLANLPAEPPLDAVGIVLDSDDATDVGARYTALRSKLPAILPLPEKPGIVSSGAPRAGVFILPDNVKPGTLEDLLLECAESAYGPLLTAARGFVDGAEQSPAFQPKELLELRKPAGRKKATVASIATILKPGRAIQNSLQDNRWLEGPTLDLPRVLALRRFLGELVGSDL